MSAWVVPLFIRLSELFSCQNVCLIGPFVKSSVWVVSLSNYLSDRSPCLMVCLSGPPCLIVCLSVSLSNRLSEWFSCPIVCLSCSLIKLSVLIGSFVPSSICLVSCKSFVLVGSCLIVWLSIPLVWFAPLSNRQSEWLLSNSLRLSEWSPGPNFCLSGSLVQTFVWLVVLPNRLSE